MIRALARASVGNHVAVNMATLAVALAGVVSYLEMPREVFPEFSLAHVEITTIYPGASPEDVERLVTLPIEDELEDLDGLDEMVSTSRAGLSSIDLTLSEDRDPAAFLADVRAAIDRVVDLPDEIEDPFVREVVQEWPVISVFVYGKLSETDLRAVAEDQRRRLEALAGVSSVDLNGTRDPELWVEVDPLALERYALSLADVERAVAAHVRQVPLGSLSADSGQYLLRVDADVDAAAELIDLPVIARPDGTLLRLFDVARVSDTFERPVTLARFNGEACLHLQVNKASRGDAIDISQRVRDYVAAERATLPAGVELGLNSDLSIYIQNRLDVMRESATIGGVLVLISLLLFLNGRIALVTALGIPVSFLGGIALAHAFGISMNMMTMFALIIVLGMIVDDAIVVSENAFRLMEEGHSSDEAAILGTAQVGKPVLATILTSIAAFLPILMIDGTMGQFLLPLPLIVTFCLLASLCEALFVLPAHLAHWCRSAPTRRAGGARKRHWYDPLMRAYGRALEVAIRWRYVTVGTVVTVTVLLVALALWWIPFHLFDEFESKIFSVNMRMPASSSLEETSQRAQAVEDVVRGLPAEEVESMHTLVGITAVDSSRWTFGDNLAQVWVELFEGGGRTRATKDVLDDLRARFEPPPPGIESIEILQPQAGPTGRAIDVSIRGPRLDVLEDLAERFVAYLEGLPGVRDVHSSAEGTKRQVTVELTDPGRLLGFDEASLAAELRTAYEGTEVGRLRRGKDDVEVLVKLPEELRARRGALDDLRVSTPGGVRVPLRSVARVVEAETPAVIERHRRERSVRVYADIDKQRTSSADVTLALLAEFGDLSERRPGYAFGFEGDEEETREAFAGLRVSGLLALAAIYVILGALFKSWTQPGVIMFAIPFGGIGMILGHLVMDRDLSFMSFIGLLALSGIVVNDSLILVDTVNRMRGEGRALARALVDAGVQRFRPILLTSITTMLGLLPLTFFATGQARFLQPMAISLFFGLAIATFLILVLVPCTYAILEDLLALARRPLTTARRLAGGELVHRPMAPRIE